MNYIEVKLTITPNSETAADIIAAILGEIGYESFVQSETGLTAYVNEKLFSEEYLQSALLDFPMEVEITHQHELIKGQDWNEEWEKNYFQPILIDDQCVIHSTFHKDVPKAKYDIVIDPKMAFGTGHHETTSLMIAELLNADLNGKSFLDMGAGTAVLAILAKMLGASKVTAIDIDEWAYENALDNIQLNNTPDICVRHGGAELLGEEQYDVIFANINRNILLNDMQYYTKCMHTGSDLYMSGFYTQDVPVICEEAARLGLSLVHYNEKNNWVAVKFTMK